VLLVLALFLFDTTDVPFIRNLPSVPGVPIIGNLAQLGTEQPKRLAELSKKHGPVFQIRLGNKVCLSSKPYH
jgi:phenylacetate 2-hydroxylase